MSLALFILGAAVAGVVASKQIFIIRHGEKSYDGNDLASEFECLSEKGWARAYNLKSIFSSGGTYPAPDAIFAADYADQETRTPNCRDRHGWYRTQQTVSPLAQAAPGGLGVEVDNSTGYMPQLCGQLVAPVAQCLFAPLAPPEWVSANGTCCPFGLTTAFGDAAGVTGECCNAAAADKVLAKLTEPGVDTVLVSWESANIGYLARALGVPDGEGDWVRDAYAYDRVYRLDYDDDGKDSSLGLVGYDLMSLEQGFATDDAATDRWLGPQEGCGGVKPHASSSFAGMRAAVEAMARSAGSATWRVDV